MSEEIAKQWLTGAVNTVAQKDLGAHMGMISKRVSLQGVPGFDNIGYDSWFAQCEHEFKNNVIKSVAYKSLKLITDTDSQILLKTYETVVGTDGTVNKQGVEMMLEKEDDGVWRLVQERVMPVYEAIRDQLI